MIRCSLQSVHLFLFQSFIRLFERNLEGPDGSSVVMMSIVDYDAPALFSHRAGAEDEKTKSKHG